MKNNQPNYYNGISNVKAAGVQVDFTKQQVEQWIKCSEDPVYFIENYCKIVDLDKGVVPFIMRPYQKRIIEAVHNNRYTIAMLFRQSGKLFDLEQLIPTDTGFKRMKDIHVGDCVLAPNGKPTKVTWESEIQCPEMCQITFDTGETIECCQDHQWTVYDKTKRRDDSQFKLTLTPKQMIEFGYQVKGKDDKIINRWYIPNTSPVDLPISNFTIDPYSLGKWLLGNCQIQLSEDDIKRYHLEIKQIPAEYIFSNKQTKIRLLQAFVDQIAIIDQKTGRCYLTIEDDNLANSFRILLNSLGIKHYLKDGHSFDFFVAKRQFTIATNVEKCQWLHDQFDDEVEQTSRTIVDVRYTNHKKVGKCIQVDNEDHLYLAGDLFVPTHNSTVMAAYLLWYATFNSNKSAILLANKLKTAVEIFSRVQLMHQHLPPFLQQGVMEWNKTSMKYENGSKISTAASSPTAVRGSSCNLLMLDEFAFLPDSLADEFIASVIPTLSSSKESKLVITSTPNGLNAFHKIWKEAEQGLNGFVAVRGYWQEVRDQKWADDQLKLLGDVRFKAEVECEFLGSSHTLVKGEFLATIPTIKPVAAANNNSMMVFENPIKDHIYAMTVDVSRGKGKDYSAFIVYDVTTFPYKIVCTFKNNKISYIQLPLILSQVGHHYNECPILIESNDLGESVATDLWYNNDYENMIWTNKVHNKTIISNGSGTAGVRTTKSVKNKGCMAVKTLIETNQLIINDERVIDELAVYVLNRKGSYSAQNTKINDDLCSCLFLFGWWTEQPYFEDYTNNDGNNSKSYMDSLLGGTDEYLPAGFRVDGTEQFDYPHYQQLDSDQISLLS